MSSILDELKIIRRHAAAERLRAMAELRQALAERQEHRLNGHAGGGRSQEPREDSDAEPA